MSNQPAFLITIDTEGDNLWSKPKSITTENSRYLPRFQELCEKYGFKPTWLTNWEMACCPIFVEFARDVLGRGAGEIGMHLHAWNSPPLVPLTADDYRFQPFLIEYPVSIIREKVRVLTRKLEETFECPMKSHRAGRWAFNSGYAQILVDEGYQVDCSVTPGISWKGMKGNPHGKGGPDYSQAPRFPYFVDQKSVVQVGNSKLLEIPMTIHTQTFTPIIEWGHRIAERVKPFRRAMNYFLPRAHWLRPNGRNLTSMKQIIQNAVAKQDPYVMFMLHSSEFMPGGSPVFSSIAKIEKLYDDMEELFSLASDHCIGLSLSDFGLRSSQHADADLMNQ